MSILLTN